MSVVVAAPFTAIYALFLVVHPACAPTLMFLRGIDCLLDRSRDTLQRAGGALMLLQVVVWGAAALERFGITEPSPWLSHPALEPVRYYGFIVTVCISAVSYGIKMAIVCIEHVQSVAWMVGASAVAVCVALAMLDGARKAVLQCDSGAMVEVVPGRPWNSTSACESTRVVAEAASSILCVPVVASVAAVTLVVGSYVQRAFGHAKRD
jgi:hypothetical protein